MNSYYYSAAQLRPGQQLARMSAIQGERGRVLIGASEIDAVVAGSVIYAADAAADLPVTGDWVAARLVEPELALIEQILPRRTRIARRAAGRRNEQQVLAANIDLAFIVCGLDGDYSARRLERYLVTVREGGVEPVVVLNKSDVCADTQAALDAARGIAGPARVLAISARTGLGCEEVDALLRPGATAVLLGSSGAGKSTLLNRIAGAELQRTAAVRESDARGRHTTTVRELIQMPGGAALIDTPGLRELQLWVAPESIAAVFDDIAAIAAGCRFADCSHITEPGCAVREAIDAARLESFHKLRREAQRVSGALTEKQRWRSIHKSIRQLQKMRGR